MTQLSDAVERIKAKLNDPTIEHFVGQLAIEKRTQRRRIVWVTRPSTVEPPQKRMGGQLGADGVTRVTTAKVRFERVQAYIRAENADVTEQLFDNLLAALDMEFGDMGQPGAYEWITEQPSDAGGGAAILKGGHLIRLDVVFQWRVLSEIAPLVVLPGIEHGC